MNNPVGNNVLVESLGSSLRSGGSALADVPALLKRILSEEAWRDFTTRRGQHVTYERFADFEVTPPTEGLGVSAELIDRIVGTDDPDLLLLLRKARGVGRGHRSDLRPTVDSTVGGTGEDSALTAARLAREAPAEFEAVKNGKSLNAAAVAAGIRPHRLSVRLDRPESIAAALRKHMTADDLARLAALLTGEA
jgi:hypothetical protein